MMSTKIVSWNVNGLRAVVKKDFFSDFERMNTSILCLQETKAQDDQVMEALKPLSHLHISSNSAIKKGYSGTAIISREKPVGVECDMGIEEHDHEGRVLMAEFDDFYLVNVYVPNSKSGLERLDYRQKWDLDFCDYLKNLDKVKPVIAVGDFNVAHREIDLARPKPNYNKSAGFTQKEIDGMDRFTTSGWVDSFRFLHPDEIKYSWWSYRGQARKNNVGWRIDFCLVSEKIIDRLDEAFIYNQISGSDHCPIGVVIS